MPVDIDSMVRRPQKPRTKDQHFVPRLHLRHFCGDSPKNMVWTYSKSGRKSRPSRVEETGFQRNYYSVRSSDGSYIDAIDEKLTEIENQAVGPYRQLLSGRIPKGQERANFAVFLATCFSRSPSVIRSFADFSARAAHLELRMRAQTRKGLDQLLEEASKGTVRTPEERDRIFEFINDPSRYSLEVSQKIGLRALKLADNLSSIFYNRYWYIIKSEEEPFITSDSPVVRWSPQQDKRGIYGDSGFYDPRAEISFPLSSSHMLLICGQKFAPELMIASPQEAWLFNRMRAANAEDLLFSDRKDDRINDLAREFRNTRPRLEIGHRYAKDVRVKIGR